MLEANITTVTAPTFWADIHIAGDARAARLICQEFVLRGLCVSISDETFVYTGGREEGVRVGLINYPRFPCEPADLLATAKELATTLIEQLHQSSCTIVTPTETHFMSRRG